MLANEPNRAEIEKYLGDIAKADAELASLTSKHMLACKGPRGKIRGVMATAKEAGVNMTAFRALIGEQRDRARIAKRIERLELDDAQDYELLREALGPFGETPLGDAALRKAKNERALDSLNA